MYTAELLDLQDDHDVPTRDINDMAAVFDREQVAAHGMRQTVEHPTAGQVGIPDSPMNFSESSTEIRSHPPLHGEHTEVLPEYGYDDEDIGRLCDSNIL